MGLLYRKRRADRTLSARGRAGKQGILRRLSLRRPERIEFFEGAGLPHQDHFLSRLDRVPYAERELALELYRDHELVEFLLARVRLPEQAERVAISLGDPNNGPFLIVTRDGRFVTCLGEGMRVDDLPIITRAQLDGIAEHHEDLRARFALCQQIEGRPGKMTSLLRRLHEAGDELSREEFLGLAALQPLLQIELMGIHIRVSKELERARAGLLVLLRRTDHPKEAHREELRQYFLRSWLVAHVSLLIALNARQVFECVGFDTVRPLGTYFSSVTFMHANVGLASSGIWSVGRMGKLLLPNYKEAYASASTALDMAEAAIGLGVLGLRHRHLRAEVQKTLATPPASFGRDAPESVEGRWSQIITRLIALVYDDPEASQLSHAQHGARLAVERTSSLPAGSKDRFTRPEDVPLDIAWALSAGWDADFLGNLGNIKQLIFALPWIADAAPEQFYLPGDVLRVLHRPWTPERTIGLLASWRDHRKTVIEDERQSAGPTRNGPCPCGSGKKYKRCCGESA